MQEKVGLETVRELLERLKFKDNTQFPLEMGLIVFCLSCLSFAASVNISLFISALPNGSYVCIQPSWLQIG